MKIQGSAKKLSGIINLPGDKSISQRALLFAALADGPSRISGLSIAEDVRSMQRCLQQLGVEIDDENGGVVVKGVGLSGLQKPERPLDCGNSGTAMRLLAGVLAGQPFDSILTGDASLGKRPMRRIVDPLVKMGAQLELSENGTAPIKISGSQLRGCRYKLPVASAQVKSAVLLAGLFAKGTTTVVEPLKTRDHTEIMLKAMGVPIQQNIDEIKINKQKILPSDISVPGDISAAAFFIVAGLLVPGSDILIKNVGMNPTRCYLVELLQQHGAQIGCLNRRQANGEPVADLRVNHSRIQGFTVKGREVPLLIDEIPVLAVLATRANGETNFRDAGELRVKESDRIASVTENLRRMGAQVDEWHDGFSVTGGQTLAGAQIETHSDHRIAMAFSVAALIAKGETKIIDAQIANVSFPGFFSTLHGLRHD